MVDLMCKATPHLLSNATDRFVRSLSSSQGTEGDVAGVQGIQGDLAGVQWTEGDVAGVQWTEGDVAGV